MKLQKPKGTLIPIGGGEDKEDKKDILNRVVSETGKKSPRICLITVATGDPKSAAKKYKNAFRMLGITTISIIHFDVRTHANSKENLEKIRKCHAVLFSGGDQLRISSLMGGTKLIEMIRERYYDEKQFVIAGTSAGAAAMSDTMIISGSSLDAMIKGELELTNGLDLINGVFIDTHFMQRGRFGRVIQTVTCNPGVLGLGLGEDTCVIIHQGDLMEVVGSGLVIIIDGTAIDYTDLTTVCDGEPISVEGIKMHVLGPGKKFSLLGRKIQK